MAHSCVKGGACSRHTLRSGVKQQVLTCSCWVRPADLGILLGMALGNEGLEPWPLTRSDECAITGFLRDKLQYRNRLQYMVRTGPRRVLCPSPPGPRPLAHTLGPGCTACPCSCQSSADPPRLSSDP